MNRRNLLTAAVASVMRPGAVKADVAAHPDADLLAAYAKFDALERAYIAVDFNYKPHSPEAEAAEGAQDRVTAQQEPLVGRMCALRAVTREGQIARARSLALWDAELMKPDPQDTAAMLAAAIVRDLLAGGTVA